MWRVALLLLRLLKVASYAAAVIVLAGFAGVAIGRSSSACSPSFDEPALPCVLGSFGVAILFFSLLTIVPGLLALASGPLLVWDIAILTRRWGTRAIDKGQKR